MALKDSKANVLLRPMGDVMAISHSASKQFERELTKEVQTKLEPSTNEVQTKYNEENGQNSPENILKRSTNEVQKKNQYKYKGSTNKLPNITKKTNNWTFSLLVGLERNIISFIYELCKASKERDTGAIVIEHIANGCNTSIYVAQKSLLRLIKKKVLIRKFQKIGRCGWLIYELPDDIYNELLHNEKNHKISTIEVQREYKRRSKRSTNVLSSSSSYLKNTTTEIDLSGEIAIPEILKSEINFGKLRQSHLKCKEPKFIQQSLDYAAWEATRGKTPIENVSNKLMAALSRNEEGYGKPHGYKALKSQIPCSTQNMELDGKKEEGGTEIDPQYQKWKESLTDDDRLKYIQLWKDKNPNDVTCRLKNKKGGILEMMALTEYYNENIKDKGSAT